MQSPPFSGKKKSIDLSGEELPPNHSKQSPARRDQTQETMAPFESDMRQPDATSDIRSSPAQTVRSTRTDPQRPRVEDGEAGQTAQV